MKINRRHFIKTSSLAGIGLGISLPSFSGYTLSYPEGGKRIGIIGLDTSHSIAFTKVLNATDAPADFAGYKVVAAYPFGSRDIELSAKRIPAYTEEIAKYNVNIVSSIAELLSNVDVVLLETNDGRLHREQALPVLKAGKPLFIDKPISASLSDAKAIFDLAEKYNVPVFSSSSLRFMARVQEAAKGTYGKIFGAETYSPATLEKTHPDLYWYGIHGVETLFAVMGRGCKSVLCVSTEETDVVIGTWNDNRIGSFRGSRSGKADFGGTCFTEKGTISLGTYQGYNPLLLEIIKFFKTGIAPVSAAETLEILAFMDAAEESKRLGSRQVALADIYKKAGIK